MTLQIFLNLLTKIVRKSDVNLLRSEDIGIDVIAGMYTFSLDELNNSSVFTMTS